MLGQRRRRWINIKTTVVYRLIFAGTVNRFAYNRPYRSRAGALVQWKKLPAWKVLYCRLEPNSRLLVSKKKNVSSLLTRKDSILWGASVTELLHEF